MSGMESVDLWLAGAFFLVAVLYGSVGHGGASGYLAMMALAGMAPATMRPTALVLNLIVSSVAAVRFARSGFFSWPLLWPFIVTSIPFAFIGGTIVLPMSAYRLLVGFALLVSALRLLIDSRRVDDVAATKPSLGVALVTGAGLGLLSGLTGVGGGIYLSPLLLFMRWATTKQTAGVAAAFIFVNSASGLAGNLASVRAIPDAWPLWIAAVGAGGLTGSYFGATRFSRPMFRRALAGVLLLASWKLLL